MTKSGGHHKPRRRASRQPSIDGGVYVALLLIGAALIAGAFLVGEGNRLTGPVALGYCAILAWLVNGAAWSAYRGRALTRWRQSLARIVLRPAGYGGHGGKPLEAAHGVPAVRTAVVVSVLVSLALLAGLALLLVPELRVWA